MTHQPALFEPDRACPVPCCGAIQLPGQKAVPTCAHDLTPTDDRPYQRPRGCVNRPKPGDLPKGF